MGQELFNPPTVFSYFPADYNLPSTNLTAPEFAIFDTFITYQRLNFATPCFWRITAMGCRRSAQVALAQPERSLIMRAIRRRPGRRKNLVDMLNTNMMHGTMSPAMRASIIDAVTTIPAATRRIGRALLFTLWRLRRNIRCKGEE